MLSGVPSHVTLVALDRIELGRSIYRITLSCGCGYWEHRDANAIVPPVGRAEWCFANHLCESDSPLPFDR